MSNPLKSYEVKTFQKGEIIFEEGAPGFEAFLIRNGSVDIIKRNNDQSQTILGRLQKGEIFGEMSILSGEMRSATAIAADTVSLVVIDRDFLTQSINGSLPIVQTLALTLIRRLKDTSEKVKKIPLHNGQMTICALPEEADDPQCKTIKTYQKGQVIFKEGEEGNEAFLIKRGIVDIYRVTGSKRILLSRLQPGELFGEMSILSGEPRNAHAEAGEEDTELVVIEKDILKTNLKETLPIVQTITLSLLKRLQNTNKKIIERPSNNILSSVCTILHLIHTKNQAIYAAQLQGKGDSRHIDYDNLCYVVKQIVPLSQYDIERVLQHLIRRGFIEISTHNMEDGYIKKYIRVIHADLIKNIMNEHKPVGIWASESDPFVQDQEFLDLYDFSILHNLDIQTVYNHVLSGDIPQSMIFLHRQAAIEWIQKNRSKKQAQKMYQSVEEDDGVISISDLNIIG